MQAQERPVLAERRRSNPLRGGLWLLLGVLLAACSGRADEAALRRELDALQEALEARNSDAVMARLTDDFVAGEAMRRDDVRRFLVVQFLRNQRIGATLGPVAIRIDGERAETRFKVLMTGGEGWLPQRAEGYEVEAGWRAEGAGWKLEWLRWQG